MSMMKRAIIAGLDDFAEFCGKGMIVNPAGRLFRVAGIIGITDKMLLIGCEYLFHSLQVRRLQS